MITQLQKPPTRPDATRCAFGNVIQSDAAHFQLGDFVIAKLEMIAPAAWTRFPIGNDAGHRPYGQKQARCDAGPVYRDWRDFYFQKSEADLNLKRAKIRTFGPVLRALG